MKGSGLPIIRCPCGARACRDWISKTERNPNRRFFRATCGFFVWCDQVKALECRCGAGACTISMATSGTDTGRWFFSCRVKQGHGACGFFQWVDPELNKKLNMARKGCKPNQSTIMPSDHANYACTINNHSTCRSTSMQQQSEHIEYGEAVCTPEHRLEPSVVADWARKDELLSMESKKCDTTLEVESSDQSAKKSVSHCENENPASLSTSDDCLSPSNKSEQVDLPISCSMSHSNIHCDQFNAWHQISVCGVPLNCGVVYALGLPRTPLMSNDNDCSLTSPARGTKVGLSSSCLTLRSDVHRDQFKVLHPIAVCKVPLNICGIVYASGFHITGWLGRLAFSPPRILFNPPPSTPFCCVFPSFNAIYVPKQAKSNGTRSHTNESQLHDEPAGCKKSFDAVQEDISRGSIMEGFINRSAMHLQTELITLLKSSQPHGHGTMLQAANIAFSVLAGLSVDFGLFYGDVLEYIDCAHEVTQIEASSQDGGNLEQLIGHYISEKHKFDEISEINLKAVTALTVLDKQLQLFRNKVRQIKNLVLQIETHMYSFEVQTLKLGECVNKITREEEEHRGKMQAALEELEEAFHVQQHKERKKHDARLALEKADNKLTLHLSQFSVTKSGEAS